MTTNAAIRDRGRQWWRKALVLVLTIAVMSTTTLAGSTAEADAQAPGLDTTMLLFDLSGSMGVTEPDGRTRLQIAQQAMIDAIGGLAPGSENVGIRTFSDCDVTTLAQAPAPVDQASLAATINSFVPDGFTDITSALDAIAGDLAGSTGRNSVILLSDGAHNCDGDPCVSAGNLIAAGIDVVVHAIGIGTAGTVAESQLTCIASVTGGTVVSVDDAEELFEAIDTAIGDGDPTSLLIHSGGIPTCANSAVVQNDISLANLSVGSTYTDAAGTLRVLTIGQSCGFFCNDGFDINCDGTIGDFCSSDYDLRTVRGIGKCLEDLAEETEEPEEESSGRQSLDEILERACVSSAASNDPRAAHPPELDEACDHYFDFRTFDRRAEAAHDAGDQSYYDFNVFLANEAIEKARAALAEAIQDLEDEGAEYITALAQVTGDWSQVEGGNPANWDDDELRLMLETIDLHFDADVVALKTASGVPELLDALPAWLQADLFTAGREVQVSFDVASVPLPLTGAVGLLSPVQASGALNATLITELQDPQIGVGFGRTQTFEVRSQVRAEARGTFGKNKLLSTYDRIKKLGFRSQALDDLLDRSRFLRFTQRAFGDIGVDLAYSRFVGGEMKWETTVSEERAARGPNALPNIYDPGSFEIGDSVLLRGSELEGSFFSVARKIKLLKRVKGFVESELIEFDGRGWGVTRIDQNTFAVFTGPIEAVESQVRAGLKLGVSVAITGGKELQFADYDYAELDMRTQRGRDAFVAFAQGLGVPDGDSAGVRTATFDEITFEQTLGFNVELGFVQSTGNAFRGTAVHTRADYADGERTTTAVYSYPEAQVLLEAPMLANGQPDIDNLVATIVMADISDGQGSVTALATAFGVESSLPPGDRFDVQFTMTGADIARLMEASLEWTEANALAMLVDDPLNDPLASFTVRMASAEDVEEAVYVFTRQLVFEPQNLVFQLASTGIDVLFPEPLGGSVEFRPTS